jgi:hypothetical protein
VNPQIVWNVRQPRPDLILDGLSYRLTQLCNLDETFRWQLDSSDREHKFVVGYQTGRRVGRVNVDVSDGVLRERPLNLAMTPSEELGPP